MRQEGPKMKTAFFGATLLAVAAGCGATDPNAQAAATPTPRGEAERVYDLCRTYFDQGYTPSQANYEDGASLTGEYNRVCLGFAKYVTGHCLATEAVNRDDTGTSFIEQWPGERASRLHDSRNGIDGRLGELCSKTPIDCMLSSDVDQVLRRDYCYDYDHSRGKLTDVLPAAVSWVQAIWPNERDSPACLVSALGAIAREEEAPIRSDEDDVQYARRRQSAADRRDGINRVMTGVGSLDDLRWFDAQKGAWFEPECKRQFIAGAVRIILNANKDQQAKQANEEQRQGQLARADVLKRRFAPVVSECASMWSIQSATCAELPGLSDGERDQCQAACSEAGAQGMNDAIAGGANACADSVVRKKAAPTCDLAIPTGLTATLEAQAKTKCVEQCKAAISEKRTADEQAGKCFKCFMSTATASKGIESWCDSKVGRGEWQALIGADCNSTCANNEAYARCLRR